MKKSVVFLVVAILLPLSAFAGKKKQQDSTDWLNAPTPDGSPTLKQTIDWLAQTLQDYSWDSFEDGQGFWVVSGFRIDNNCNFSYTKTAPKGFGFSATIDVSFPLGAITSVEPSSEGVSYGFWGVEFETGEVAALRVVRRTHGQPDLDQALSHMDIPLTHSWGPQARPGGEVPPTIDKMVPRIVSAFQHAVSLCQSTYKAPTQAKQPF